MLSKKAASATLATAGLVCATIVLAPGGAGAISEEEAAALAKETQNPVSSLISVPFESNFNFGQGSKNRTGYVLNIQPVVPVNLGALNLPDWNLINRSIVPIVYQPDPNNSIGGDFGLGDINHSMFLSPAAAGPLIWGAGPIVSLPTSVNDRLGPSKLSFGPTAVIFAMPGDFTTGLLVSNLWSVAGDSDTPNVNFFTIQPIINYNLPNGWYLSMVPVITADWRGDSGDKWTVPLGGGIGKILRLGAQPLNLRLQAFGNATKPDGVANWLLQFRVQFLFPKSS